MTEEDLWFNVILVIICLSIFIPLFILAYKRMKMVGKEWKLFAQRHGLSLDNSAGSDRLPIVQGNIEGRSFRFGGFRETSSSVGRMSMELEIKGKIPNGLYLHGDYFSSGLVKSMVVRNDIEVGDTDFDKKVIVSANNSHEVITYLNDRRKRAVLDLIRAKGFVKDKKVILHSWKNISNQVELDKLLDILKRTALELDGA